MAANFDGARARTSHGALGLVAMNVMLIVQMLSFGIFPVLVDGLVRLAHLDTQQGRPLRHCGDDRASRGWRRRVGASTLAR
jgi:hypothetical protein